MHIESWRRQKDSSVLKCGVEHFEIEEYRSHEHVFTKPHNYASRVKQTIHEAMFVTGDTAKLFFVHAVPEILNATFYKCLEIDGWSILKQIVEFSIQYMYFHAQHAWTMMLPYQKLPHVYSASCGSRKILVCWTRETSYNVRNYSYLCCCLVAPEVPVDWNEDHHLSLIERHLVALRLPRPPATAIRGSDWPPQCTGCLQFVESVCRQIGSDTTILLMSRFGLISFSIFSCFLYCKVWCISAP